MPLGTKDKVNKLVTVPDVRGHLEPMCSALVLTIASN